MLGIIVPAHNEQELIVDCLASIREAATHPRLRGEPVEVLVVLDACTDATGILATRGGAMTLRIDDRNVGMARALGAEWMLARGARWLAFTDADTRVDPAWLAEQLALRADAVCGTVGVADWSAHGVHAGLLAWHFDATYDDAENHRHVHGANLGVSARAYRRAGGFRHLACSEDVALVDALISSGAHIAWSARPRVLTSARKAARAQGGFADALVNAVAERLAAFGAVHSPRLTGP